MDETLREYHEVAQIFPLMQGEEFESLKKDIKDNGLREPIWLDQNGWIIDGRNRHRACIETDTQPVFRTYTGKDLINFVVSMNLHRRHLSEAQRSVVGAKIANMQQGARTDLAQICAMSQDQAAELLSISRRSLQSAKKVLDQGVSELINMVESNDLAVSTAETISKVEPEEQKRIISLDDKKAILAAAKEIQQKERDERRLERIEKIVGISANNKPLYDIGIFNVIYADPPWRYDYSVSTSREIENQYPTMELEDICNLPVSKISADDCVLFLWATSPKLLEAIEVIKSWGFTYKTNAVWVKDKIGMGYYFRQQHELLLVATKGNIPTPEPENRYSSIIQGERTDHSSKPELVYSILEKMYPEYPRVELFCRDPKEGWAAWGNQC